jgi:hypothetical protein
MRKGGTPFLVVLAILSSAPCGHAQESTTENLRRAREALWNGVEDFKAGLLKEAIEYFIEAKELDPTLRNARRYLGTAYAN